MVRDSCVAMAASYYFSNPSEFSSIITSKAEAYLMQNKSKSPSDAARIIPVENAEKKTGSETLEILRKSSPPIQCPVVASITQTSGS